MCVCVCVSSSQPEVTQQHKRAGLRGTEAAGSSEPSALEPDRGAFLCFTPLIKRYHGPVMLSGGKTVVI